MKTTWRAHSSTLGAGIVLVALVVAFLLPSVWLLVAAFDPEASLQFSVPSAPDTSNFERVVSWETLGRPILVSLFVSLGASALTATAAFLAAYPLSRYNLRFGQPFLYFILLGSGLPVIALVVPAYGVLSDNDLTDSLVVTAVFLSATSLPFAIWLAKNFIDDVPVSLEEAALCDGASTVQIMTQIVLPLIRPGMAVILIFTFVANWGNFIVPFLLINSPEKQTASVSLYNFFTSFGGTRFGELAAYSLLYSIPAIILYSFISRAIGNSFAFSGGVKE